MDVKFGTLIKPQNLLQKHYASQNVKLSFTDSRTNKDVHMAFRYRFITFME